MTCITQEDYDDWSADLVRTRAKLAAIDAAIDAGPLNGVKSYTFDSGTGRQQEVFNSPQELFAEMYKLEAHREYLKRKLRGTAIQTTSIRRSRGSF